MAAAWTTVLIATASLLWAGCLDGGPSDPTTSGAPPSPDVSGDVERTTGGTSTNDGAPGATTSGGNSQSGGTTTAPSTGEPGSASGGDASGTYRCRSYNFDGAGGSCSLQRALTLATDGTYSFGSSTGTWRLDGTTLTFTGDLASRGPATYDADRQVRWRFDRDGHAYTITYYRAGDA